MIDEISYNSSPFSSLRRSEFKLLESNDLDSALCLPHRHIAALDIINLSKGGHKVINIARANDLAAELPDADSDPGAFSAALERAIKDINRIMNLFNQVLAVLRFDNIRLITRW